MTRRSLVLVFLAVIGAIGWILIDADPQARAWIAGVWEDVKDVFQGDAPPANWGDVAEKVGQFGEEERALREALNPALSEAVEEAETPPAVPGQVTPPAQEQVTPPPHQPTPVPPAPVKG